MFNIGLLHTSLTGAEGHDPYSPCTPAQLADKNYDYWALGHVHARGSHGLPDAAPIEFPGNTQGRHIRESGPKGCLIVHIDDRGGCRTTIPSPPLFTGSASLPESYLLSRLIFTIIVMYLLTRGESHGR